jgi:hypothetical protein
VTRGASWAGAATSRSCTWSTRCPPDLKPLEIGALSDDDLGKPFAAIGYGIQDNGGSHGTRRLGRQTLKGREGRTLEHLVRDLRALPGMVHHRRRVGGEPGQGLPRP